jgi:hypothetical protein
MPPVGVEPTISAGERPQAAHLVRDTTVHTLQLHFLKAHFDIFLSSTLWSAKCSLVFMCSERKRCRPTPLPSFPYVLHAAPIADSLMDHPNSSIHCDNITRVRCSLCQSCQLLGIKSSIGPNMAFFLRMETDSVYETFCYVRQSRQ